MEPMFTVEAPRQNHLLAALSDDVYQRLLPRLQPVTMPLDGMLIPPHAYPHHVYFPTTGMACWSLGIENGVMAKTWLVGNEGMVGVSAVLGGPALGNQVEVDIPGEAFQLDVQTLKTEFQRGAELQKLLLRYVDALIMQASQLAVCGQYHSVDQRVCRILILAFDRMPTNTLAITQQRIARLLGVRRESVTAAARRLEAAGIIRSSRGRISLLNRESLEARACTCYGVIRNAFTNLRRNPDSNAGARTPAHAVEV